MAFEIIPFQDELLDQAAALLAERHRRNRLLQPDLPASFEDPKQAGRALAAACQRTYSGGVAAVDASRLLGFLTGDLDISQLWSRSAWVRSAGYAVAEGQSLELLQDL